MLLLLPSLWQIRTHFIRFCIREIYPRQMHFQNNYSQQWLYIRLSVLFWIHFKLTWASSEWPQTSEQLWTTSMLHRPIFIPTYDSMDPHHLQSGSPFSAYASALHPYGPLAAGLFLDHSLADQFVQVNSDTEFNPLSAPSSTTQLDDESSSSSMFSPSSNNNFRANRATKQSLEQSSNSRSNGHMHNHLNIQQTSTATSHDSDKRSQSFNSEEWPRQRIKGRSLDNDHVGPVANSYFSNAPSSPTQHQVPRSGLAYGQRRGIPRPVPAPVRSDTVSQSYRINGLSSPPITKIRSSDAFLTGTSSHLDKSSILSNFPSRSNKDYLSTVKPTPIPHYLSELPQTQRSDENLQWPDTEGFSFPISGLTAHYTPVRNLPTTATESTSRLALGSTVRPFQDRSWRKPSGSNQRRKYALAGPPPAALNDADLYTAGGTAHQNPSHPISSDHLQRWPEHWADHWPPNTIPRSRFAYNTADEEEEESEGIINEYPNYSRSRLSTVTDMTEMPTRKPVSSHHHSVPTQKSRTKNKSSHAGSSKNEQLVKSNREDSAEMLLNSSPVQLQPDPNDPDKSLYPLKSSRHTISSNNGDVTVVTETVYRGDPHGPSTDTTVLQQPKTQQLSNPEPSLINSLDHWMSTNHSKVNAFSVHLQPTKPALSVNQPEASLESIKKMNTSKSSNGELNKLWDHQGSVWNSRRLPSSSSDEDTSASGSSTKTGRPAATGSAKQTGSAFVYVKHGEKGRNEGMSTLAIVSIVFSSLLAALLFTGCTLLIMYKVTILKKRRFLRFGRNRNISPEVFDGPLASNVANLTKTNPLHNSAEKATSNSASPVDVSESQTKVKTLAISDNKQKTKTDLNMRDEFHSSESKSQTCAFKMVSNAFTTPTNNSSTSVDPATSGTDNNGSNTTISVQSVSTGSGESGGWIRTLKTTATEPTRTTALSRFLGKIATTDDETVISDSFSGSKSKTSTKMNEKCSSFVVQSHRTQTKHNQIQNISNRHSNYHNHHTHHHHSQQAPPPPPPPSHKALQFRWPPKDC